MGMVGTEDSIQDRMLSEESNGDVEVASGEPSCSIPCSDASPCPASAICEMQCCLQTSPSSPPPPHFEGVDEEILDRIEEVESSSYFLPGLAGTLAALAVLALLLLVWRRHWKRILYARRGQEFLSAMDRFDAASKKQGSSASCNESSRRSGVSAGAIVLHTGVDVARQL